MLEKEATSGNGLEPAQGRRQRHHGTPFTRTTPNNSTRIRAGMHGQAHEGEQMIQRLRAAMHSKAGIVRALAAFGATTVTVAMLAGPAAPASAATGGSTVTVTGETVTTTFTLHSGHKVIATSTNGVTPQIIEGSCGGKPNWVHLYTVYDGDLCFGYTGSWSWLPYEEAYGICWGNNYGRQQYTVSAGIRFYHWIAIDGWSGSGTCSL
jgi:hypothetical protein